MFETLHDLEYDVLVESVYWAMLRLFQRNVQLDIIAEAGTPEEAAEGDGVSAEDRVIHRILHEIREAEGKPLSTLTDGELEKHIFALSDILDERDRDVSPETARRAELALEEMRRMYPSPIRLHQAA
jgi:hypothetical protein